MSLSDVVNITVSLSSPGVTQAGFGTGLIATPNATWPERTRTYGAPSDADVDWPAGTPERGAINAYFAQQPRPPLVMVGRLANHPTMIQVINVVLVALAGVYKVNAFVAGVLQTAVFTPVAAIAWQATHAYLVGDLVTNGGNVYKCTVAGVSAGAGGPAGAGGVIVDGGVTWKYQGVSVGGTANDCIVDGLVAALNALAAPAPNFTAAATGAPGAEVVTCTGNAAGNWFATECYDLNYLNVLETEADAGGGGIAADLAAINAESIDWYGLILLFKSPAIIAAAAGWVETQIKLMVVSSADSIVATTNDSVATDIVHALKAAGRARTAAGYHPRSYEFLDAAAMGRWFPIPPGGDNWRMKPLSGPTAASLPVATNFTETYKANVKGKNGFYFYIFGGVPVFGGEGVVAAKEYIDILRGLDWYVARLGEREANVEIDAEKIPFTDDGIALLENQIRAQNAEGIQAGLIAPFPKPTVSAPLASSVPSADKTSRTLNGLNTKFTLAGAINHMNISVTATQ